MGKTAAIDWPELARFIVTGAAATFGNIAAVGLARLYESFEISLLVGIAAGITISFTLSKWFAFGSRSWSRTGGEAARFLIVYSVGCAAYWAVAVVMGRLLLANGLTSKAAEMWGILIGAGTMTLTSYFGHRFFTYRTYRSAANRLGGAS